MADSLYCEHDSLAEHCAVCAYEARGVGPYVLHPIAPEIPGLVLGADPVAPMPSRATVHAKAKADK